MEQRKKESGIRLEDVAAGYGRKSLLNHISLHVSPGNVLTLIGPNGAGKSTILKTVTRQLAELGGTIFLEGTSMSRMREEEGCSGYVHCALGNNETDNQDFILHIDMMFKDPTIELDGKVIFDHGEVVFD